MDPNRNMLNLLENLALWTMIVARENLPNYFEAVFRTAPSAIALDDFSVGQPSQHYREGFETFNFAPCWRAHSSVPVMDVLDQGSRKHFTICSGLPLAKVARSILALLLWAETGTCGSAQCMSDQCFFAFWNRRVRKSKLLPPGRLW